MTPWAKCKKYRGSSWICAALAAVTLSACSTGSAEKKVDAKLGSEPEISSSAQLSRESDETIANAPGITEDQKQRLLTLRKSVQSQSKQYGEEALKLKNLLVKELVSQNYQAKEVDVIKKKLKDLESKRLNLFFEAIEQANLILERNAKNNEKTLTELFARGDHSG